MKAGNHDYNGPEDMPAVIPVFPLAGVLLLPRGQLPLNIFEPRYLALIDAAMAGNRLVGMIQPQRDEGLPGSKPALRQVGCVGRITGFAESGDGRYVVTLTGIARFRLGDEVVARRPYRQCKVDFTPFPDDFIDRAGESAVDRAGLLDIVRAWLDAHNLEADWDSINSTPNEQLVNGFAMMSPYGPAEKQALLEAPDLKTRAETLVALAEMSLARESGNSAPGGRTLQ